MPRVLAVQELPGATALDHLRRRREDARRAGANYWAFRGDGAAGTLTEFVEATSSDAVRSALAALGPVADATPPRFLVEVEF
jgi:hypothetical protein